MRQCTESDKYQVLRDNSPFSIRGIVNYKELDTRKIKDYILSHPDGVEVEDIIAHSGAEKLRVYPALFELEQEGLTEREELGSAKRVKLHP